VRVTVVAVAGAGNTLLAFQPMVASAVLPHLPLTPAATRLNCCATCASTLGEHTSVAASATQAAYFRVLRLFEEQKATHVPADVGDAVSSQYVTFGVPGMPAPASPCLPPALPLLCVGPVGSAACVAKRTEPQAAARMTHLAMARMIGVKTPKSLQVMLSLRRAQVVGAASCGLHAAALPKVPLALLLPAKLPSQMGPREGK